MTYDIEVGTKIKVRPIAGPVKWGMMIGSGLISRMVIIGQKIKEIQMFV